MSHVVPSRHTFARIDIFTHWFGFGGTPVAAKLTITRRTDGVTCERALAGPAPVPPDDALDRFFAALARPPVRELDPALFDLPPDVIRGHYGSIWTNDNPSLLIRATDADGRRWEYRTDAQYAFMLPFRFTSPTGDATTFDPELSRAAAALLPDDFPEKERLAGRLGMLEYDLAQHDADPPADATPPEPPAEPQPYDPEKAEAAEREIFRILSGEESPAEKEEAERSGRISDRLLRRIPTEDVPELIAAGADVNTADEHGQTALMNAAWPPFNQQAFRLLVEAGAAVDARRYDGYTGLHLACSGGEARAVAEWVRAGADVNARTPEGHTPLMLGATWPEIVATLRRAGADATAVDSDGHSALVCAIHEQCSVVPDDQLRALEALLKAGCPVNARDPNGVTPLGHALGVLGREQLADEVRREFRGGADRPGGYDWSAVRLAERVVKLLRSAGAVE